MLGSPLSTVHGERNKYAPTGGNQHHIYQHRDGGTPRSGSQGRPRLSATIHLSDRRNYRRSKRDEHHLRELHRGTTQGIPSVQKKKKQRRRRKHREQPEAFPPALIHQLGGGPPSPALRAQRPLIRCGGRRIQLSQLVRAIRATYTWQITWLHTPPSTGGRPGKGCARSTRPCVYFNPPKPPLPPAFPSPLRPSPPPPTTASASGRSPSAPVPAPADAP